MYDNLIDDLFDNVDRHLVGDAVRIALAIAANSLAATLATPVRQPSAMCFDIGDVPSRRRDALVGVRHGYAHGCVHPLGASPDGIVNQRSSDATTCAGGKNLVAFKLCHDHGSFDGRVKE